MGNKCPSVCGSTWKAYDPGSNSFVADSAISVQCIGIWINIADWFGVLASLNDVFL